MRFFSFAAAVGVLGSFACQPTPSQGNNNAPADAPDASSPPPVDAGVLADAGPPSHREDIAPLVAPLLDGGWVTGLVVAIVTPQGDEVLGFGETAVGSGQSPDGHTVYEIGSITKTFTGLLLADAVQRGVTTLDTLVKDALQNASKVPDYQGRHITFLDLATHASGLPSVPSNLGSDQTDPYSRYSPARLYTFLNGYELTRAPGSAFEYSNLGAGLEGHALGLLAGSDYAELLTRTVLVPLGMTETDVALVGADPVGMAPPHHGDLGEDASWHFTDAMAAAGAIRSTGLDMQRYMRAQLGITATPLADAIVRTHEEQRAFPQPVMGLHWFLNGSSEVWHNGATGGFESMVVMDLERKIGVTVLCNTATSFFIPTHLGNAVLNLVRGTPHDGVPLPNTVSLSEAELEAVAGIYASDSGPLVFSVRDGRLQFQLGLTEWWNLYPESPTTFHFRRAALTATASDLQGGSYRGIRIEGQGIVLVGTR